MIRLGLSGRIIEESGPTYQMSVTDFIAMTAQIGYRGVELRWGQLDHETSDDDIAEIADALTESGVACAFANCLVEQTPHDLQHVRRMAEVARSLATPYLRMGISDVQWVQKACDIAAESEVGVIVQIHTGGPTETIEGAMRICQEVDRPNFGLTYEPANFVLVGRDYGQAALETLGDKLFNVSLQNLKPVETTEGEGIIVYQDHGFTRCEPSDPDGVNFSKTFAALKAVGYNGFATLIEPMSPVTDSIALAEAYYKKFKPLC